MIPVIALFVVPIFALLIIWGASHRSANRKLARSLEFERNLLARLSHENAEQVASNVKLARRVELAEAALENVPLDVLMAATKKAIQQNPDLFA